MEKEPLVKSERFKVALTGIILELLVLFAPSLGVDADPSVLQVIAGSIAGLLMAFIAGRSYRNTPTKIETRQDAH